MRRQKIGSFGFLALALCIGKNQMCLFVRWPFCMKHNVIQLGDVAEIEEQNFNFTLKFN
jgi:hypothetical protein